MNLVFTDGTESFGAISDQDGQLIDADSFQQVWHYRRVDLSPYAGKTFSQVRLVVEGLTQPGQWHAFYQDIVLVSADGTVQPLYSRQKTITLSPFGTLGMTQVSYEVNHISPAGQWPTATTTYYHGDYLGSARLLSSENGYPVWQAAYLPFGQEWNPQITVNNYKFTGKERDPESGLDNFIARYNSSSLGRFMSPDPDNAGAIDEDPQTWNAYSYVRNNPLRYTDPDGTHVRICVDGASKCYDLSDDQYKALLAAQNNKQGITLPTGNFPTGNITCGGQKCGTATHFEPPMESANGMNMLIGGAISSLVRGGISIFEGLFGSGTRQVATEATTGAAGAATSQAATSGSNQAVQVTVHAAARAAQRGISQGEIDAAVQTAKAAGRVVQQIGKYGTPQEVYQGTNGVTVVVETAGRNAGKAITVWRQGTTP